MLTGRNCINSSHVFSRHLNCKQNKNSAGHGPEVATVEALKTAAVGQSKKESSSSIQTVFKRSKNTKLKNKRIPEVLYHQNDIHVNLNCINFSLYSRYIVFKINSIFADDRKFCFVSFRCK